MASALQSVAGQLDLNAACVRAARSSDLIPERPEDNVGGSLGRRFADALAVDIASGAYEPTPAHFIAVPKRGFTTRPAAVLALADRVVYDALVATFEDRIEKTLVDNVMWPRGRRGERRWADFIRHPVQNSATTHVVESDISGFYESIDHQILERRLIQLTGRREAAEALTKMLSRIMGGPRGIPQGLDPSDALATVYLTYVDGQARVTGLEYVRNGDDMRIACDSFSQARQALATLETAVRSQALLLNSSKTRIVRRETYEEELAALEGRRTALRSRLVDVRRQALLADEEQLQAKLVAAGFGETAWAVWYHETQTAAEAIELLREQLDPSDGEVAEALFRDTIDQRGQLDEALFHQSLVESLRRLQAMRSPAAISDAAQLLLAYPDKVELLCRYLLDVASSHATEVAQTLDAYAADQRFRTDLEWAWVLRVASHLGVAVGPAMRAIATSLAPNESVSWVARAEAIRVRAATGALDAVSWQGMWRIAPSSFRPDLVEAAVLSEAHQSWPTIVIDNLRHDAVLFAVAAHARSRRR